MKLNFNAETLAGTGNKVLGLAERTRSVVNNIQNEIENFRSAWEGTTNSAIVQNLENEIGAIKTLLNNYESTGNNIVKIARDFGGATDENVRAINSVNM